MWLVKNRDYSAIRGGVSDAVNCGVVLKIRGERVVRIVENLDLVFGEGS